MRALAADDCDLRLVDLPETEHVADHPFTFPVRPVGPLPLLVCTAALWAWARWPVVTAFLPLNFGYSRSRMLFSDIKPRGAEITPRTRSGGHTSSGGGTVATGT